MKSLVDRWLPVSASRRKLVLGILLVFSLCRMASMQGWDDAFYVAQLRSAVRDGDLMLQDDLLAVNNPLPLRFKSVELTLPGGALVNTFSVGPAVLHSFYLWPFLRATPALGGVIRKLIACGSLALLVLLCILTAKWLESFGFGEGVRVTACLLALLSGPLAIYGTRTYLNAHLPSALCAAALLWFATRWLDSGGLEPALATGLSAGLLVITRWQDLVLVLALSPCFAWVALRSRGERKQRVLQLLAAAGAFGAAFAVQVLAFRVQFGSYWLVPQGSAYMHWSAPAIGPFLLSSYHGLVPWAPGLALGLMALPALAARVSGWRCLFLLGLVAGVLAEIYVCASVADWWGGNSFGPRRLAALAPVAALGLAFLLARLPRGWAATLTVSLAAWSVLLASAFLSGCEDLKAFFFGGVGQAGDTAVNPWSGWIDRWGPLHFLKPGFTFSDKPTHLDRLIGLLVVSVVVWGTCAAYEALGRRPRARRLLLGAALAWPIAWIAVLFAAPSNAPLDRAWLALVEGHPADLAAFPADIEAAGSLVKAAQALRAGRRAPALAALEQANRGTFLHVDPDEAELLASREVQR